MIDRARRVLPEHPAARRLLVGTLLASSGQGMTLPFLFIYLTQVRHLSSGVVGLVVGWQGLLALVLGGPGGALVDRYGVRRVVLPLYLVDAVGVAAFGFVTATWQAFGAATLSAVGQGVLWAASSTLLSTVTGEHERQRVFGLWFATLNLGLGTGGFVAGLLADVHSPGSFRTLYLVDAVLSLTPAAILLTMPTIGHRIVAARTAEAGAGRGGGYREVLAHRAFRRFLCFAVLITACGYAQFEVGLPAFASLVSGVSTRVVAWALAANTVTIVLAQLFVSAWMQGRSRSRALAGVGGVIGAAWAVMGVTAWLGGHGSALATLGVVGCTVVFACGETVMSPVMPALTNALATDELRGRYNSMSSVIWGLTGTVGPLTAAPLIGHGLGGVWVVLIVVGSLAAGLVAVSLRRLLTPVEDGRVPAGAVVPAGAQVAVGDPS